MENMISQMLASLFYLVSPRVRWILHRRVIFFVGNHTNFMRVNKIEVTKNEASRVNVNVEPYFQLRVIYLYRKNSVS